MPSSEFEMEENPKLGQGNLEQLINSLVGMIRDLSSVIKQLVDQMASSRKPVRSTMTLKPGEIKMPLTVTMGDPPGNAIYQEFNAAGEMVPPLGTVHFASDNESVATVDANGVMTYVGPGSCNIVGADDGTPDGLPANDSLQVNPKPADTTPVSSTLTLQAGARGQKGVHQPSASAGAGKSLPKFSGGKFVK